MFRRSLAAPVGAALAATPSALDWREWRPQQRQAPGTQDLALRSGNRQLSRPLLCEPKLNKSVAVVVDDSRRLDVAKRLQCDPDRSINDHYELTASVGTGGFGVVVRAIHKDTGIRRAVKKVDLASDAKVNALVHESQMMRTIPHHPSIVNLVDCFVDDRAAFLVMELCYGVDLFDWIDAHIGMPVNETEVSVFVRHMVSALHHCHQHRLLHLDVKPENFVFESGEQNVMLIDFGLAESMDNLSKKIAGTEGYFAPEAEKGGQKSPAMDAWSLGITLFVMLTGGFMPNFKKDHELDTRSKNALNKVSAEARDFCNALLCGDPAKRLSMDAALNHDFLKGSHSAHQGVTDVQTTIPELEHQLHVLVQAMKAVIDGQQPVKPVAMRRGKPVIKGVQDKSAYILLSGRLQVVDTSNKQLRIVNVGESVSAQSLAMKEGEPMAVTACTEASLLPITTELLTSKIPADRLIVRPGASDRQHLEKRIQVLCHLLPTFMQAPPTPKRLRQDEILINHGTLSKEAYLILSGHVQIKDETGIAFAESRPGEIIGEMGAMLGTKRTADVVATTDIEILPISKDVLQELENQKAGFLWLREVADKREIRLRVLQFLRTTEIFSNSQLPFLHALVDKLNLVHMSEGVEIISQGTRGDNMYILRDGQFDVVKSGSVVGSLKEPGTIIGEMALIDPDASKFRTATVIAKTNCVLLELRRTDFDDVVRWYPDERARFQAVADSRSSRKS